MTYRKAVDLVLLKKDTVKVPLWYLEWNRELYYIDMREGEIHIVVPTQFHNIVPDELYEQIPDIKIESFLDLTKFSIPIQEDTISTKDANSQDNVKILKKYLDIESIDLSDRYV